MSDDTAKPEPPEDAPARTIGENAAAQTLIHFYRGELARSDTWRTRLDTTTNWAVVTTAAILSVGFGSTNVPTVVFPFATCLLLLFLSIEARRYRYYEVSIARVRALEQAFVAPILAQRAPDEPTLRALEKELERPEIRVTQSDAIAVRLWRAYAWLFAILYLAWFARIWTMPYELASVDKAFERLRAGPIPGSVVLGAAAGFLIWIVVQTAKGFRLSRRDGGRIRPSPLQPPH